ncbi:hypothetical protein EVAR_64472_1 [Eumeta japonica]|uniref:Zinc finger PHD-type domain-containing protein n=1 Tax=Eumeta variegata TaxID=151549 RepID=A0A4C1ZIM0_EUMVA|nr:hypothetical protein EVAR_64472_1 [Eumeta japonica]
MQLESDEDFLAAEVLQSEPIVVQDTVDSILESNAAGDLPLSVPTAIVELRQGSPIPNKTRKKKTARNNFDINTDQSRKKNKRKAKALKGKGKGVGKKSKPQKSNVEKVKKKILQESNDTSMSDVNTDELCQNDEDDDAEDAGDMCIVCGEFGRDRKIWYRCTSCGLWAHADCTGWDSAQNYVCDMC